MKEDPKEKALYYEKFDMEWEIFCKLQTLIDASWDSNTLKQQLETLVKNVHKIHQELDVLESKKSSSKN